MEADLRRVRSGGGAMSWPVADKLADSIVVTGDLTPQLVELNGPPSGAERINTAARFVLGQLISVEWRPR